MTEPTPAQPASNAFKAIVRSIMPWIISSAASAIAHFGYHVTLPVTIQILGVVGAFLVVVLHTAETRWPWVGVLLGYVGAPVYAPSVKVQSQVYTASLEARIAELEAAVSETKNPSPATAQTAAVPEPTPAPAPAA